MKILFTGGGTGGHVFPSLAIADQIKILAPDISIMFCGTRYGIEKDIVPKQGYKIKFTSIIPISREISLNALLKNLTFPFLILKSFYESSTILKKNGPFNVIVAVGGYASFPVTFIAQRQGIKSVVLEQNADLGLANRLLVKHADEIYLAFSKTKKSFSSLKEKCYLLGTPSRRVIKINKAEARESFGLDPNRKTLLVFGGSLGASSINQYTYEWIYDILNVGNLIWQTGRLQFGILSKKIPSRKNMWIGPFINDMNRAYQASDLVLCRSGASTIAELRNYEVASMLIPYPYAAGNHQLVNAKTLSEEGSTKVILDSELKYSKSLILDLLADDQELEILRKNIKKTSKKNSALTIAKRIIDLAHKQN